MSLGLLHIVYLHIPTYLFTNFPTYNPPTYLPINLHTYTYSPIILIDILHPYTTPPMCTILETLCFSICS